MAVSSRDKAVNGLSLSRESSVKVLPSNKMSKYTKREVEGITPLQQNVKSGKAYIYGKRDVLTVPGRDATGGDDGSDSETVVEIKPRRPPKGRSHAKRERKQSSSQFIEEDIVAGETVQSMAIRYGCSVSYLSDHGALGILAQKRECVANPQIPSDQLVCVRACMRACLRACM